MSLSTAIAVIVVADLALVALLVYAMSHAGRLTPHVPAAARRGAARAREAMAEEARRATHNHHHTAGGHPSRGGRAQVSSGRGA
jgi:hypothetical protein